MSCLPTVQAILSGDHASAIGFGRGPRAYGKRIMSPNHGIGMRRQHICFSHGIAAEAQQRDWLSC